MKIVIAGGSGFIGRPLVARFADRGDEVVVLTRTPRTIAGARVVAWDGRSQGGWSAEVAAADAVVNLAGESIAEGRWTRSRKDVLVRSRIDATAAIVGALRNEPSKSRTLVNASAIGFYGLHGDDTLDEDSAQGSGFLAELCARWESAAREAEPVGRVAILRFGVVLGPDGGALAKLLLPFRLGAGGPVGTGEQWMSWIDGSDLVRMVQWVVDHRDARGIYNATAPEPVRNREFARSLGRALRRPAVISAPAFAMRLAFGQMADEVLLGGQRVLPKRALADGFLFEHTSLDGSLKHLLQP